MKFIRFILMVLVATAIFFFVNFLNVKLLFSSTDTAKKILKQSDIYPAAAAGIRNNIVKYAQLPDNNKLIEVLNNSVTEESIQNFIEDFADQFFATIKPGNKYPHITIHFSWLRDKVNNEIIKDPELKKTANIDQMLADRNLDLSKNIFVKILININKYLLGSGLAIVFFSGLLFLSGNWSQKLAWLGAAFIISTFVLIVEISFYVYGMNEKTVDYLAQLSEFKDEKFIAGVKKLIIELSGYQKNYYIISAVGIFILGIIIVIIAKALIKHNFEIESKTAPEAPEKATSAKILSTDNAPTKESPAEVKSIEKNAK